MGRGKKEYEPPRYMSINTAIEQLLEVEESRAENGSFASFFLSFFFFSFQISGLFIHRLLVVESNVVGCAVYSENTLCVGLARLGTSTQKIVAGPMKELLNVDFGLPLHSLVIAGTTHVMEEEFLSFYKPS